jgi:cytochrome c oxidase subunit 2
MKVRTGNPNFVYEISCDQMCGKGHFSMRGVIVVEKEADYKKWLASQTPEYITLFPGNNPNKPATPVVQPTAVPQLNHWHQLPATK